MTTCPVCAARDAAREGVRDAGPPPAEGAALLVRVWREDGLRARLLAVDPPYRTLGTAAGIDAICDAVRAWVARL